MNDVGIRRAGESDTRPVADLLTRGFEDLALHAWLVPEADEHDTYFPGFFEILVAHAVRHGSVYVAEGFLGAAVWQPVPSPPIEELEVRLAAATGPHAERFSQVLAAMERMHPRECADHDHLEFLAVHPRHRGRGIGSLLLAAHHTKLDRQGRPAYLEATSVRSRDFFQVHGYEVLGPALALPYSSEAAFPMWRPAPDESAPRQPDLYL